MSRRNARAGQPWRAVRPRHVFPEDQVRVTRIVALNVALLCLPACGEDTAAPEDPDIPEELIGTWAANPACLPACGFTVFPRTAPADSINIVRDVGVGVELTIRSSGRLSMEVTLVRDTLLDGNIAVRDGQLLVSAPGESAVDTLDYALAGDILRVELRSQVLFDFNGDGTDESVGMRGAFRRR
jgi:hypothetical protein